MSTPLVTIVVPNWNTGPLLRICISSVLRYTKLPYRLVVVDAGSTDASRQTAEEAAAKGLIQLITRDQDRGEGAASHGANLDAGLAAAETPYLFTLDSDAWARREGWLGRYLHDLQAWDASHAGATKFPSPWPNRLGAWLRGKKPGAEAAYVRPCHALYRVDVLRRHGLSFAPEQAPEGRWRTTGQAIHERLVALGYRAAVIPHAEVEHLVGHLRHATFVINADHFTTLRERARRKGARRIRSLVEGAEAAEILAGSPLSG